MWRFILACLLLSACEGTPTIKVTLQAPPEITPPAIETLEVTISAAVGGVFQSNVRTFNAAGEPFPMSFVLTFTPESQGLEALIDIRGFSNGQELFSARAVGNAGDDELFVVVLFCGDGVEQPDRSEQCDDGNDVDGDGCDSNCTLTGCGNGITTESTGEECDDANFAENDGCDPNCTVPACRNGVLNEELGEECDDGNDIDGDGCDSNCTTSRCGNGIQAPGEICFAPPVTLSVGVRPVALALGDFNNDGLLDIAAANQGSDDVSLAKNLGGGQFLVLGTAVGAQPSALIAADFDKDGLLDLATADTQSDTVSVLRNEGGSFSRLSLAVGSSPVALAIADFKQDGSTLADLICANQSSLDLSFIESDLDPQGEQIFKPAVAIPLGGGIPVSLTAGSFDGDQGNRQDLAIGFLFEVSTLSGNGLGAFTEISSAPATINSLDPDVLASSDLNGDSLLDLAVAQGNDQSIGLLLNEGDGQLAPLVRIPVSDVPSAIAVSDLTGDGIPELLATGTGQILVLLGQGNNQFGVPAAFLTGAGPNAIAIGDLNGDSIPDLVTANATANSLSILIAAP
jgi:cysteine-rich repeat protein